MKSFRQHITEQVDRLEFVKNKFLERRLQTATPVVADREWTQLIAADPNPKKIYVQWVSNLFLRKNIRLDDLAKVKDDLTIFDRVKARMPSDQRDINRYKQYQDLYDALQPFVDSKSNKQTKRDEIDEFRSEITTLYRGEDGGIYIPQTERASQFLGRGTRWCTAATHACAFKGYSNASKMLIVFIDRNGTKVQLHAPRQDMSRIYHEQGEEFFNMLRSMFQFADESDRSISIEQAMKSAPIVRRGLNIPQVQGAFLVKAIASDDRTMTTEMLSKMKPLADAMKAEADELLAMFEGEYGHIMKAKYKTVYNIFTIIKGLK